MNWLRQLIRFGPTSFEAMLIVSFGVPAIGLIWYVGMYFLVKAIQR